MYFGLFGLWTGNFVAFDHVVENVSDSPVGGPRTQIIFVPALRWRWQDTGEVGGFFQAKLAGAFHEHGFGRRDRAIGAGTNPPH